MKTTVFDIQKIDDEILNYLRSLLHDYDPKNRTKLKTTEKIMTSDDIYYVDDSLNFVRKVEINDNELLLGRDYEIMWRDENIGSIKIFSDFNPDDILNIEFGVKQRTIHGKAGSFVYPDRPKVNIGLDSMPRVGFTTTFSRDFVGTAGGNMAVDNNGLLQIRVVDETTSKINKLVSIIDEFLIKNYKSFYYVRYIDPTNMNAYDNFNDNTDKPFSKIIEYDIPNKYQVI